MSKFDGGQTVRCKFCGALYIVYAFYAGPQDCCAACRSKAEGYGGYQQWPTQSGHADVCPTCNGTGRKK
jgi:hypothetical protein